MKKYNPNHVIVRCGDRVAYTGPYQHEGSPIIVYRPVEPLNEMEREYCLMRAQYWLSVTPGGL